MGNTENAFRNMFFAMMTQLFNQFMGNNQEPQPQQPQQPHQPKPEVVRLAQTTPLVPTITQPKVIKKLKCTPEDNLQCTPQGQDHLYQYKWTCVSRSLRVSRVQTCIDSCIGEGVGKPKNAH
ncbi:hypothetical protein J1N35_007706 [Gossypium stocksii]|uniref:Uncharacterized protein n=1 Tax=Gossypium stocksii TaxID=47602 RepID=A0A9D4AFT9_9ROSI|nr:hypothetical protein J1N35_007706 [Gossypium stocksii]